MGERASSMENMGIDKSFWKDRKVFITGHTGFKGSWLSLWLNTLGAKITGYSLEPSSESIFNCINLSKLMQNNYIDNILHVNSISNALNNSQAEIIIHLAAQPLVKESYLNPINTYETNVMGLINVFEAARNAKNVKAIINITTDKCYKNNEWLWGYRENDELGGYDPYSNSKACAELVSQSYRDSFFNDQNIGLATARAGNVLGGGDWAKNRIVPDAMRSFIKSVPLTIRSPKSIRPWQHVLDALSGYIILAQNIYDKPKEFSEGWNFAPNNEDVLPVSKLADIMTKYWGEGSVWELDKNITTQHEAQYLKLDCSKAKARLKWRPIWKIQRALKETVEWYKVWNELSGEQMLDFTVNQISKYQKDYEI